MLRNESALGIPLHQVWVFEPGEKGSVDGSAMPVEEREVVLENRKVETDDVVAYQPARIIQSRHPSCDRWRVPSVVVAGDLV